VPSIESGAPEHDNATRALPNGLQIEDLVVGTGPLVTRGAHVSVRYLGRLLGGTVFDDEQKHAIELAIGKHQLIEGWEQGLLGMKVGGTRRLVIPPALGYGTKGSPPKIPPNATIVFEITLDGVK
jgi:FK506-binding nuclear protein